MKLSPRITVGTSALMKSLPGLTFSPGKNFERIAWPAGFGAFAITVKPPPVTAPATTAYFSVSENPELV